MRRSSMMSRAMVRGSSHVPITDPIRNFSTGTVIGSRESDVTDVASRIGLVGEDQPMRGVRIVATVATAVIMILGTGAAPAVAASGTGWDPRIAGLARAVERLRGLDFEHPVPVRVLDDAAFEKQFAKGQKISGNDRKELHRTSAALLAIGLLEKPLDPDSVLGKHLTFRG